MKKLPILLATISVFTSSGFAYVTLKNVAVKEILEKVKCQKS